MSNAGLFRITLEICSEGNENLEASNRISTLIYTETLVEAVKKQIARNTKEFLKRYSCNYRLWKRLLFMLRRSVSGRMQRTRVDL